MSERGMMEPGKPFETSWHSNLEDRNIDLTKELNPVDLERVRSLYNYKQNNRKIFRFAQGGPVVSNVNQDFDLYAQNRGGMMMSKGGNMYFEGGGFDPNQTQYFQPNEFGDIIGADEMYGLSNFESPITNPENPWGNQLLPNQTEQIPGPYNPNYVDMSPQKGSTLYGQTDEEHYKSLYPDEVNYNQPMTEFDARMSGQYKGKLPTASDSTTPWYEEPWYSKLARYAPLAVSAAGVATGLMNKKRRLDPTMMTAQKVNYEPERIVDREESRRRFNTFADRMKNSASNAGMLAGNLRGTLLGSNKDLAGRISESIMREENTNAQLAQQADMTNTTSKNQFKQINESMFQNAQTQALRAAQEGAMALQSGAEQERDQYLQEWLAKNRLNTRSYKTNIDGRDVYVSPDGKIYDEQGNAFT